MWGLCICEARARGIITFHMGHEMSLMLSDQWLGLPRGLSDLGKLDV